MHNSIWFQTQYPANWIKFGHNIWYDRQLMDAPLNDKEYEHDSRYLVYVLRYVKDKGVGFFKLRRELRALEKKANRDIAFPEAHLLIQDIISVYFSTFREWLEFNKWQKLVLFRNLFQLNGMDVSDILFDEWDSGYWGLIQYCKLHGIATMRFLNIMDNEQTIITYLDFFIETRADYHLRNFSNHGAKFYTIQHSQLSRNYGEAYNRKSEFSQDGTLDHVNYCPSPDYYLAHGKQYADILSEFYPKEKINIVGSLKIKQYLEVINESKKIKTFCLNKLNLHKYND